MTEENRRGSPDADFTGVTFDDIKRRLVDRAKNYYPDTYKDFNKTSFGSMMLDLVSLVGEQLHFYSQFVANENFVQCGDPIIMNGLRSNTNLITWFRCDTLVKSHPFVKSIPKVFPYPSSSTRHHGSIHQSVTSPSGVRIDTVEICTGI